MMMKCILRKIKIHVDTCILVCIRSPWMYWIIYFWSGNTYIPGKSWYWSWYGSWYCLIEIQDVVTPSLAVMAHCTASNREQISSRHARRLPDPKSARLHQDTRFAAPFHVKVTCECSATICEQFLQESYPHLIMHVVYCLHLTNYQG